MKTFLTILLVALRPGQVGIDDPKSKCVTCLCGGILNQNVSESAAGPAGLDKRHKVNTSKIRPTIRASEQGSKFKSIGFSLKNEGHLSRQISKLRTCIYVRSALDFKKNILKKSSSLLIWINPFG